MSNNANFSTHPGAIDGLALGKPIAGGEHPTLPTSSFGSSTTGTTGTIGSGSGLAGDDLSRSAVASGVGAGVGAGVGPGSGEKRLAALPVDVEADSHPLSGISSGAYGTGSSSGLTGGSGSDVPLRDTEQGIKAGMGIGHR